MNLDKRIAISRRVTLTSYAALLAALITGWLAHNPSVERLDVLFIQIIPLLLFLPGMLRRNSMVHLYMSCVLLLYITMAVTNLMLWKAPFFSMIETLSSLTLFAAAMMFIRDRRIKRQQQN